MNSSLSPNFEALEVAKSEASHPQEELTLPNLIDSSDAPDESVQSLYATEPIEYSVGNSLPPRGQVLFQRGMSALNEGKLDNALEIWRQAHAEFPSHAIIAHNLGLAAGVAQQYGEAIAAFHKANELDPSLIVSNLNGVCASMSLMSYQTRIDEFLEKSKTLRKQGRCEEAEKTGEQLLNEYPHSSAVLAELCLILTERSHRDPQKSADYLAQALRHARRAIFLDPNLPAGFIALATAQRFLGTHREAFASSLRLIELQHGPDSSLRLFAGEHALRASRAENNDQDLARIAVEYADQVIAEDPDNVRAWTLRADANAVRVSAGIVTYNQSLTDFERLLQLDAKNAHAVQFREFLLAQCYPDEVVGTLGPAFKEAQGYLQANDNQKALPLLRQILKEEPDNRATLSNLSLALRRLKQFDEALSVQTRLAELSPTPESWRLVATIALQLKNYQQASGAYTQVIEILPDDARSHRDVATTLEVMGRVKEAIPYWRRVVELTPEDENAWSQLGKNLLDVGCSQKPVDEFLLREAIPALDKAHILDGNNSNITNQLAVGLAEAGELERAHDYASRLAGHDPVAHSTLVQLLTDIHGRRLSEGLAPKPISTDLSPSLIPPHFPVEHTGEYLVAQPFSPVTIRTVSPWLVGLVGLMMISGIWTGLQLLGFSYAKPPLDPMPPTTWNGTRPANVQPSSLQSFPPPPPSITGPVHTRPSGLMNSAISAPLMGKWTGLLKGTPATLLISKREGKTFYGDIFWGDNNSLQVRVVGALLSPIGGISPANTRVSQRQAISWRETQIISNPQKIDWSLGEGYGMIIQTGDELQMRGVGKHANGRSGWLFTRDAGQNASPVSTSNSNDSLPKDWSQLEQNALGFAMAYPAKWIRSSESLNGIERISFKAPSANVHVVMEVSSTSPTSPLKNWRRQDEQLRRNYGRDYRLLSMDKDILGGDVGDRWQFELKRLGETPLRKIQRCVIHNGRAYTMTQVAPAKDFDKLLATFDMISSSLLFR